MHRPSCAFVLLLLCKGGFQFVVSHFHHIGIQSNRDYAGDPEKPSHSIPLGLPENDNGTPPTGLSPKSISFCAYEFDPIAEDLDGSWKKVFYNAANRRRYTVVCHPDGDMERYLTIPDSMAFYKIDDKKNVIEKYFIKDREKLLKGMDDLFEMDTKRKSQGGVVKARDGRWCYRIAHVATSVGKEGKKSEITTYMYYDMETGIRIRQDGGNKDFLRGIQTGLFYPELFELPKGYKIKSINLGALFDVLNRSKNNEGKRNSQQDIQDLLKALGK